MTTSPTEANKELVREYVKAKDEQEFDRVPEFFADSIKVQPVDDRESEQIDVTEFVEGLTQVYAAFPDLTHDIKEMAAEGGWVIYRTEWGGTHEAEFRGIEPTGTEVSGRSHQSRRVEDGEIVEMYGTVSWAQVFAQLGVDIPDLG